MLTVYGHRGLPSKAPENTIASFKAASEVEGINWLELDVAITKDEQLIIIHDDYLERTTNMSGEITELNYDEIIQEQVKGRIRYYTYNENDEMVTPFIIITPFSTPIPKPPRRLPVSYACVISVVLSLSILSICKMTNIKDGCSIVWNWHWPVIVRKPTFTASQPWVWLK